MIVRLAERSLRTQFGDWAEVLYYDGDAECVALVYGTVSGQSRVPFRVHSDCISAHVFNSIECDCREQLAIAQIAIQEYGCGAILWLDQDGRGNGHMALMLAASLATAESIPQTEAYEKLGFSPDARHYGQAAAVIADLGILSIELLTDSPEKASALRDCGINVESTKSVSLDLVAHPQLRAYYADKVARGYSLPLTSDAGRNVT